MPVFCNCCGNDVSGPGCARTGIKRGVPVMTDGALVKPCPFCHAVAVKLKHSDLYKINHHKECWFSGKDFSNRASLIEPEELDQWNSR